MEKRVLIAILLSALVIFTYPYFVQMIYPPQPAPTAAPEAVIEKTPGEAPAASLEKAPVAAEVKEELTTVETPLFKAVFTSIGGGVKSFDLKKYSEKLSDDSKVVNLAATIAKKDSFKTQLSLSGVSEDIYFTSSQPSITIAENESAEFVFSGTSRNGIKIEKKYSFTGSGYIIGTEVKLINETGNAVAGSADTVLESGSSGQDNSGYHTGPLIKSKDELVRQDPDDKELSGTNGKLKWIGLEDKYFLSALIPSTSNLSWKTEAPSLTLSTATLRFPISLGQGEATSFKYESYLGPKEYDRLVKLNLGLEDAVEFGFFDFMAKPFLVVLNFFEKYIGNYGIAIIIVTFILKVIFYPLTKHSLNSMREMQKIQPQLAALRERYKDDKDKLNRELMDLYKRYNINPLGGCLPIVLQIPVFIALYEVLYVAIELRHAPFFLWIHDLSDKDPYYITPLLMGATMFIQQKMTPTTVDPAQAKIMLLMPVIFTFMFLNFPSGLVLYWLVNNVLSISQQYYIQKAAKA